MSDKLPEHKHEIGIRIGANDWRGVLSALHAIAYDVARHEDDQMLDITSGGADYSYILVSKLNQNQTAALYIEEVNRWIEARRAEKEERE